MVRKENYEIIRFTQKSELSNPLSDYDDQFNIKSKQLKHKAKISNLKSIYSMYNHGKKLLLATEKGGKLFNLEPFQHKEFIPNTRLLCSKIVNDKYGLLAGDKGVYLIDLESGDIQWQSPLGLVYNIEVVQNQRKALACLYNHSIAIIDILTGDLENILSPMKGIVRCIAVKSNGGNFVTGHWDRQSCFIIWSEKGEIINVVPHLGFVRALALKNNTLYSTAAQGIINAWKLSSSPHINKVIQSGTSEIYSLAISSNGKFLAVGDDRGRVSVINTNDEEFTRFDEHKGIVTNVGFINNDETLYSSSIDGTIIFRDLDGDPFLVYRNVNNGFLFETPPDPIFKHGKFYTNNSELIEIFEQGKNEMPTEISKILYFSIHNDPKILLKILDKREAKIRDARFQILTGLYSSKANQALKLLPPTNKKRN